MNNNIPYGNDGIDSMNTGNFASEYVRAEIEDSKPPVDAQAPSIQPLPFEANNENLTPRGGTILSSTTYNISDSGVKQVHSYSHNTSDQAELRMRQEQQRVRQTGRSIYSTPPTSSGAPSIQEEVKPTEDQLTLLRKRDRLANCLSRLKSLQINRQRTALKLKGIDEALKALQEEVEQIG